MLCHAPSHGVRTHLRGLGVLLTCGSLVSCAGLLGADGDYEETNASTTTAHTGKGGAGGAGGGGGTTSTGTSTSSTATGTGGGTTSTATTTSTETSTSTGTSTNTGTTTSTSTTSSTSTDTATTTSTSTTSTTTSTSTTTTTTVKPVSWHRYSFDMAGGTWSSAPLSSVWTGVNAPPTTGIIAATHLDHFDKLLVVADNGKFYVQESSVWRTPVNMSVRFPEITSPTTVAALRHVPSDWNQDPPPPPLLNYIYFFDNPAIDYYHYNADNTTNYGDHVLIQKDASFPGPPQMTGRIQWNFEIWNKSQIGTGDGFSFWESYGDGYLYKLSATSEWTRYAVEGGPFWAGKPNAPDWSTIEAAYFVSDPAYDGTGIVMFIGP